MSIEFGKLRELFGMWAAMPAKQCFLGWFHARAVEDGCPMGCVIGWAAHRGMFGLTARGLEGLPHLGDYLGVEVGIPVFGLDLEQCYDLFGIKGRNKHDRDLCFDVTDKEIGLHRLECFFKKHGEKLFLEPEVMKLVNGNTITFV